MSKRNDEPIIPKARGKQTPDADFDRNRDGLYGGLPKARDKSAPGPKANEAHPPKKEDVRH